MRFSRLLADPRVAVHVARHGKHHAGAVKAARQPEQPEIHLRPNRAAKYEHVAAVLSSAQRLGVIKIGLVGSERFAR